ncbi:MAG: hypothetical protein H0X29_02175 [Parachlamydiaceae bacterium]|nr:hypothetical protein [Parachlamydiaceae bacterium]
MIISGMHFQTTLDPNFYCDVIEKSFLVGSVLGITGAALSCLLGRRQDQNLEIQNIATRTWVVCCKGTYAIGALIMLTSLTSMIFYGGCLLSPEVK